MRRICRRLLERCTAFNAEAGISRAGGVTIRTGDHLAMHRSTLSYVLRIYTLIRVHSILRLSRASGNAYAYSNRLANTRELTRHVVPVWLMVVQWCRSRCLQELPGRVPIVGEALARVAPAVSLDRSPRWLRVLQ